MSKPSCVKKTLNAGRGRVPEFRDGTKAYFHYETLKPIKSPGLGEPMPENRDDYVSIDSTRKSWPDGYGKTLEIVFGKKFQLPIFETCLRSMLEDERYPNLLTQLHELQNTGTVAVFCNSCSRISQFDVELRELTAYPLVSKKLRDIAKSAHDGSHHHDHMCAAALAQGTGYEALDDLMANPTPLRFVIHLLKVEQPEDYEAESWQMGTEQKMSTIEKLRLNGNELYMQKEYKQAIDKYREALGMLDVLLLREKPGEPEWDELDQKNVSFYLNLSQCYLLTSEMYHAEETASEVLSRDEANEKALYRRAKARIAMWKLDEAESDLEKLLALYPDRQALIDTEKAILAARRKEKSDNSKKVSGRMLAGLGQ